MRKGYKFVIGAGLAAVIAAAVAVVVLQHSGTARISNAASTGSPGTPSPAASASREAAGNSGKPIGTSNLSWLHISWYWWGAEVRLTRNETQEVGSGITLLAPYLKWTSVSDSSLTRLVAAAKQASVTGNCLAIDFSYPD